MKIEKIVFHNFKCFYRTHSLDNLSKNIGFQKNINLVGGYNGAGKTTIFESVLLCLYAERNRSLWPSKGAKREEYENYIISISNRKAKSEDIKVDMYVKLTFSEIQLGDIPQYIELKRTWLIDPHEERLINRGKLYLHDYKNNKKFDFCPEEEWEDFIEEMIPYEVSQFFFFDGEKIQEFVRDEDKAFAESMEKILGITHYNLLKKDLGEAQTQITNELLIEENIKKNVAEDSRQIAENKEKIILLERDIESYEKKIQENEILISELEKEAARRTNVNIQDFNIKRLEKEKLLEEKVILENKIFIDIEENLFPIITAKICNKLIGQLEKEKELLEYEISVKSFENKINNICRKLFEGQKEIQPLKLRLSLDQIKFYYEKLEKILKDEFKKKPEYLDEVQIIHELSSNDSLDVIKKIRDSFSNFQNKDLSNDFNLLQEIESKIGKISQSETRLNNPETQKIFETKGGYEKENQSLNRNIELSLVQKEELEKKNKSLQEEINKKTKKAEESSKILEKQKAHYNKYRKTIEEFSIEYKKKMAKDLEERSLIMWKEIARKDNIIEKIKINPDKFFTIDLFDSNDKIIDKTKLSAGEKEILALSLVYALIDIRKSLNIPIIIDTPLGRLDSIHRENITKGYFPNIGDQVILLSTDEEIIGKELETLKKLDRIANYYFLESDKSKESSRIIEGKYFD